MKTAASAQKLLDKTKRQLEWAPTTPGPALDSLVSDLRALKREQAPGVECHGRGVPYPFVAYVTTSGSPKRPRLC
jgi:hypothetical protein